MALAIYSSPSTALPFPQWFLFTYHFFPPTRHSIQLLPPHFSPLPLIPISLHHLQLFYSILISMCDFFSWSGWWCPQWPGGPSWRSHQQRSYRPVSCCPICRTNNNYRGCCPFQAVVLPACHFQYWLLSHHDFTTYKKPSPRSLYRLFLCVDSTQYYSYHAILYYRYSYSSVPICWWCKSGAPLWILKFIPSFAPGSPHILIIIIILKYN